MGTSTEKRFFNRRLLAICVGALALAWVSSIAWRRMQPPEKAAAHEAISVSKPLASPADSQSDVPQNNGPQSDAATGQTGDSHALDPVLAVAHQALTHLQETVDDYSGRLIKRERVRGTLGGESQMEFKIRARKEQDGTITRPLSAYLKFVEPASARGREVIWTEGSNGNKLIAHEAGMLNLMRVELEPTGMLAMMDSKYPITEIGLTKLVEKLIEKGERDRKLGPCEVQVIEGQRVGDRECQLIQVKHPNPDPRFDFHIAQIFIDTERMIPLRYAAFLWPKTPGDEPPLEEEYTYLDLKLNVGLTDTDFDPDNPAYKFP